MQGMACGIVPSALRLARLKLSSTKSFYYTEEFCRETAACVAVQHKDNPLERKVHCRERRVHTPAKEHSGYTRRSAVSPAATTIQCTYRLDFSGSSVIAL